MANHHHHHHRVAQPGGASDNSDERLSRWLSYVLRHGALSFNLRVYRDGWVAVNQLVTLRRGIHHARLLDVCRRSRSARFAHQLRFVLDIGADGQAYVRAAYGITMNLADQPQLAKQTHIGAGTSDTDAGQPDAAVNEGEPVPQVPTLTQLTLEYLVDNVDDLPDLGTFPDGAVLDQLLGLVQLRHPMTMGRLQRFLVPALEALSLQNIHVSDSLLGKIARQCPNLERLNLAHCAYAITDLTLRALLRKLPRLTTLNLQACHRLTDAAVLDVIKFSPQLQVLVLAALPNITTAAVEALLHARTKTLTRVDLRRCPRVDVAHLQQTFGHIEVNASRSEHLIAFFSSEDVLWGDLSPYGLVPIRDDVSGLWPSVMHFYQGSKTADAAWKDRIRHARTGFDAHRLGHQCPLEAGWDDRREEVMAKAYQLKAYQHVAFRDLLVSTKTARLVFNSRHDSYWGTGSLGRGQNVIGVILERLRAQLGEAQTDDS